MTQRPTRVEPGIASDPEVQKAKERRVQYEQRKAQARLKRLLSDNPQPGDFIDLVFDWTDQACGVDAPAPRGQGAETIQRFEGGRDVGIMLRAECRKADPGAMTRGFSRALKRTQEREERFKQIEDRARQGKSLDDPKENE